MYIFGRSKETRGPGENPHKGDTRRTIILNPQQNNVEPWISIIPQLPDCVRIHALSTIMWVGSIFWPGVSRACVSLCAPVCFDGGLNQLCLWREREIKKRKRKQQTKEKNRKRCGSRRLPGIVRVTEEGGGRGKVRTLLKEVHQSAETVQSVRLAAVPLLSPTLCLA